MEQGIPIEEIANQRLSVLVNAYTLFIKNLQAQGVALETVKAASDATWEALGAAAGQEMKVLFKESPVKEALFTSGTMGLTVHGMAFKEEIGEAEKHVAIQKCPWHEAGENFDLPQEWRLCQSGHTLFSTAMLNSISSEASFEMTQTMPAGDDVCAEIIKVRP